MQKNRGGRKPKEEGSISNGIIKFTKNNNNKADKWSCSFLVSTQKNYYILKGNSLQIQIHYVQSLNPSEENKLYKKNVLWLVHKPVGIQKYSLEESTKGKHVM